MGLLSRRTSAATCANYAGLPQTIGFYYPTRGAFYLYDSDGSGFIQAFAFGPAGPAMRAVAGDWAGRGFEGVGVFDPASAEFRLKDDLSSGEPDHAFHFGEPGSDQVPVAGDWHGKGRAGIGVFDRRTGEFRLRLTPSGGTPDLVLPLGDKGDGRIPITGVWTADGRTGVGLFDQATGHFIMRTSNDPRDTASRAVQFGPAKTSWQPVIGRWTTAMRTSGFGLHSNNNFFLRNALEGGNADTQTTFAPQGNPGGLMPQALAGRWKPSRCRQQAEDTEPDSPDWAAELIVYELRLETFAAPGVGAPLVAARNDLARIAALGVTCILLDPIEAVVGGGDMRGVNAYGPNMPDRVNQALGTPADLRAFVDAAHAKGMKVIADVVLHGLDPRSPYAGTGPEAFPPDWFGRTPQGAAAKTGYGTIMLDYTSPGLRDWWMQKIGIGWVGDYDLDGFRMDLEPRVAGTPLWNALRAAVKAKTGKTILLMPEIGSPNRGYTFDCDQGDLVAADFYEKGRSVVDTVKASPERFYTSLLSNHDSSEYYVRGRLGALAYGAILSPFIPLLFAGEEMDARADLLPQGKVLYFSQLHRGADSGFAAQMTALLAIRKQYRQIIAPMRGPLRQTNIVRATRFSGTDLEPYMLWQDGTAIAVVASRSPTSTQANVSLPLDLAGLRGARVRVTNLLTNETGVHAVAEIAAGLAVALPPNGVAPLKIEAA